MRLKDKNIIIYSFIIIFLVATQPSFAQNAKEYFKNNCTSCHTIGGGKLIGPDLKDVLKRKDRDWLIRFVLNPQTVIESGDPYALALVKEANGVMMITLPTMNPKRAEEMVDLLEAESELKISQFVGANFSGDPLTAQEVFNGTDIYSGVQVLENGGPACIACHTVNKPGPGLGGNLGPDLTLVYNRMNGNKALMAWLSAPPTTTMQSIFRDKEITQAEIRSLVAFLESSSKDKRYNFDFEIMWISIVLYGFGGVVLLLVIFGGIWNNRFRSVRRALVNKANKEVYLEKEQIDSMD